MNIKWRDYYGGELGMGDWGVQRKEKSGGDGF